MSRNRVGSAVLFFGLAELVGCSRPAPPASPRVTPIRPAAAQTTSLSTEGLGTTPNVHAFGGTLLCGQPSPEDLQQAKARGIKTVVTLREESETDWDEAQVASELGLEFHRLAFSQPDTLTDQVFAQARQLLVRSAERPVLLHCGGANRVGAIWLAYRVLDQGVAIDQATKEAREVGLRSADLEQRALEYIRGQLGGEQRPDEGQTVNRPG